MTADAKLETEAYFVQTKQGPYALILTRKGDEWEPCVRRLWIDSVSLEWGSQFENSTFTEEDGGGE